MGNYSAALPLYEKSLQIRKEAVGENHLDYASSLNNLATLYLKMGKYSEALPLYKEALKIRKEILGENHSDYATSLNNLGLLYKNMGNYSSALPLYKEAIRIDKKVFGENHPDYGIDLYNFAMLYKDMGSYDSAVNLLRQVIKIDKNLESIENEEIALDYFQLGNIYKNMGRLYEAIQYYDSTLIFDDSNHEVFYWRGKCKYFTGDTLGTIGDCQAYSEKSDNELRKIFCLFYCGQNTEALIKMEELVKNDPDPAYIYSLSTMYALNGRITDALEWFERSLKNGYSDKQNILTDPNISSIRDLEEFKKIMEKYFK